MTTEGFSEDDLARLERDHKEGLTSEQIVTFLGKKGIHFTEATLRKYVQLGLLPTSRRVGMKGKHRGSQGMYPVTIIRRIQRLRALMVQYTIEEIQQQFLFVRGDIEELERALERVFSQLSLATKPGRSGDASKFVSKELSEARSLAAEMVGKLTSVEARLTMQARLQREAV
jgi:DNA-binding transcriptional MerR regulator